MKSQFIPAIIAVRFTTFGQLLLPLCISIARWLSSVVTSAHIKGGVTVKNDPVPTRVDRETFDVLSFSLCLTSTLY